MTDISLTSLLFLLHLLRQANFYFDHIYWYMVFGDFAWSIVVVIPHITALKPEQRSNQEEQ